MKMSSLSNLLRWGSKKKAALEVPKKEVGRAEESRALPTGERRRSIRWPKDGAAKMSWIGEDGSSKSMTVWLKNSGEGGMGLISRKPVAVGREVWVITDQGEDWQGVVRYCHETEAGYQVGFERIKAKMAKPETSGIGAQLKWIEKPGKMVFVPVQVRNAGDGRLEVVASKPVPAPAIMLLLAKEVRCLASANACHKRGNRFLVEMEVISDTYRHPAGALS
jgi:hypothetical protein